MSIVFVGKVAACGIARIDMLDFLFAVIPAGGNQQLLHRRPTCWRFMRLVFSDKMLAVSARVILPPWPKSVVSFSCFISKCIPTQDEHTSELWDRKLARRAFPLEFGKIMDSCLCIHCVHKQLCFLAGGEGFEPSTPNLGGWCSVRKSYKTNLDHHKSGRGGKGGFNPC